MAHGRSRNPAVEVELPVTPMLDMTFQLLIFFILTFRPQAMEGQVSFSLPSPGEFKTHDVRPIEPPAPEVELPPDLTVVVKTVRDGVNDGAISQLLVRSRTGEQAVANLQGLGQHLRQLNPDRVEEQAAIQISADGTLKYACLMEVMDVCRKAGFRVGFAPPADLAR